MARLIPIIGLIVLSAPAWAELSAPIILSGAHSTPPAATSAPIAPTASKASNSAQPYLPPSLSPQTQINSAAQKSATTAPAVKPSDPPSAASAQARPASGNAPAPQSDLFRQPMTDVNNIREIPPRKRKGVEFRKRKEGKPAYFISVTQPRVEITLYTGSCYAENRPVLRQQLVDRGLDSKRTSVLKAAYAATPTGRVKGCWYYVRQGDYFRVALENGQGEDFAREQVDRIR